MHCRSIVLIALSSFMLIMPDASEAKRVYDPSGSPPEGGWPVLVYLAGYGITKEIFDGIVEVVNEQGVALVALHAPKGAPSNNRRNRAWTAVIEPGHALAQATLESMQQSGTYNLDRVYLAGYADAGLHAAIAVMAYPESYCGAISASPATAREYPEKWDGREFENALFLMHAVSESDKESVQFLRKAWRAGGGNFRAYEFPGLKGENIYWKEATAEGLRWLMNTTPTTAGTTR